MSCPVSISLGAYALDALDPVERETVRRHLTGCPRCAAESADLARVVALLRRLVPPGAGPGPPRSRRAVPAVRSCRCSRPPPGGG